MERSISEGRRQAQPTRMRPGRNFITSEKGRRYFRYGEEEHAERRGDSGGHDGGVECEGRKAVQSMEVAHDCLMMGQVIFYTFEKLIICAAESEVSIRMVAWWC